MEPPAAAGRAATHHHDRNERRRVYVNLANVGAAFLFIFACYCGLDSLQSAVNVRSGLRTTSVGVVCACSVLSSLFIAPSIVDRMSARNALQV